MANNYRGEGHKPKRGCKLIAHYKELQVYCDALGWAAQQRQARFLEQDDLEKANYWYGIFQGLRTVLRAVEGNIGELTPEEQQALTQIDWSKPQFQFPGIEEFHNATPSEPGADYEAREEEDVA
jgi:hypothetical protein